MEGARPKPTDPYGYHMVWCKIGAKVIRLHDEVVFILAKLIRSLRVDAIVEPLRIFSGTGAEAADILIRDTRGFGRQVILDVELLQLMINPERAMMWQIVLSTLDMSRRWLYGDR